MLPSGSPVTGHVVSKSGVSGGTLGELVKFPELTELVPLPQPAAEITAIASKISAINTGFFINAQITWNKF